MKVIGFILSIFLLNVSFAQTDTIPLDKNLSYKFDSILKTNIPIYNYSNIWDFDGDKINDSLWFIGNGGAHEFYYLRMQLSSNVIIRNFHCIQLDMPYLTSHEKFIEDGFNPFIQFVVNDFDRDNLPEIFFNLKNVSKESNSQDTKNELPGSPYILVDFKNNKLILKNY